MATLTAQRLWDSHPYPNTPCDTRLFGNQCAIRLGIALSAAGADLSSFTGARCYRDLRHSPRHILRAQELANWLVKQILLVGPAKKYTRVTHAAFSGKRGIVFIMNGWGATDHIDVWIGTQMKGGSPDYISRGREVWFWELPL